MALFQNPMTVNDRSSSKYLMSRTSQNLVDSVPGASDLMAMFGLSDDGSIEFQSQDFIQGFGNILNRMKGKMMNMLAGFAASYIKGAINVIGDAASTGLVKLGKALGLGLNPPPEESPEELLIQEAQPIATQTGIPMWKLKLRTFYLLTLTRNTQWETKDKQKTLDKINDIKKKISNEGLNKFIDEVQQKERDKYNNLNLGDEIRNNMYNGVFKLDDVSNNIKTDFTINQIDMIKENSKLDLGKYYKDVLDKRSWNVDLYTGLQLKDELNEGKFNLKDEYTTKKKEIKDNLIKTKKDVLFEGDNRSVPNNLRKAYARYMIVSKNPSMGKKVSDKDLISALSDNPDIQKEYQNLKSKDVPSATFFYNRLRDTTSPRYNLTQSYRWFADIDFTHYSFGTKPRFSEMGYGENKPIGKGHEISFFLQGMVLPNMVVESVNTISTDFGYMNLPDSKLVTDQQSFSMELLDTNDPIFEGYFLPWMQEVTADTYIYPHRPFMKADITVTYFVDPFKIDQNFDFGAISFLTYTFRGCFPYDIGSRNPNHNPSGSVETRSIRFQFETMTVGGNYNKLSNYLNNKK